MLEERGSPVCGSGAGMPTGAQKPLARACVRNQPIKSLKEANYIDWTVM